MKKIIQPMAASSGLPRRTVLRGRRGGGEAGRIGGERDEAYDAFHGRRPDKINCFLCWKSKIKAIQPLIPSASLCACPNSVGRSGGFCVL